MPARIKAASLSDIKLRANIADVVSRVVTLRKAGASRLKGLCPFHNEKTPSFQVDTNKGLYYCFGCRKSGDAITFVRDTEQLDFTEAVEALAQRFGVPLEYEAGSGPSREERSLRQELFDLHDAATEHFHQAFLAADETGAFMRAYWHEERKFPLTIASEFKIGAADAAGSGLAAALMKRKFSEEALRRCGLFFARDNGPVSVSTLKPRFRGRLMIPIRDHQERVVAFTARQTKLTPEDDPAREAKYVNSPETPIFIKGNLLFNLDRARTAVGEGHPFVLVEGQLDAIRCWSAGVKTAVAPQGTAITESQLVLLRRYHSEIECFFDSDSAGQKAALRLLPMALRAGLEIRFLTAPGEGKMDPDLVFLEGGLDAYARVRAGALPAMPWFLRYIEPSPESATPERLQRAQRQAFELIANAESESMRDRLLGETARHLRASPNSLRADFDRFVRKLGNQTASPASLAAQPAGNEAPRITPERDLLLLCVHHESLGKGLERVLPLEWINSTIIEGVLLNRFLSHFHADDWPGRDNLDPLLETAEERALIANLLFNPPNIEDPAKVANEGLRLLRARALEPRLRQIELDLANHRTDIKFDPISLFKERTELQRLLRQPLGLASG